MKNISTQKERIIQFIEYKGISKNKFYIETGISNGVLDKKSGLSMDTIEKFYSTYPDINPEWLLTGEGEMLKEKSNLPIAVKTYSPDMGIPLIPTEAMGGIASGEVSILELDCERYVIPRIKSQKTAIIYIMAVFLCGIYHYKQKSRKTKPFACVCLPLGSH